MNDLTLPPGSGEPESVNLREALEERYPEGDVPHPEQWGGYLLKPTRIEFWQGRESRLHDRFRYTRQTGGWLIERLAP